MEIEEIISVKCINKCYKAGSLYENKQRVKVRKCSQVDASLLRKLHAKDW